MSRLPRTAGRQTKLSPAPPAGPLSIVGKRLAVRLAPDSRRWTTVGPGAARAAEDRGPEHVFPRSTILHPGRSRDRGVVAVISTSSPPKRGKPFGALSELLVRVSARPVLGLSPLLVVFVAVPLVAPANANLYDDEAGYLRLAKNLVAGHY